ncbi:hypothetical protein DNK47_01700 [Mycoplasma wenyonii]|uniref:Uncharacterized protein n=1 Tax=Mycoplasma wenyonii TaxID=65123 RepID=A0A328PRW0_9MOLU|nr:hypothetical protein [Mycoplasma wenyonii]RAO95047.1 hypothetical protein DNK47_01700 [Mycoplasma wenyonii]
MYLFAKLIGIASAIISTGTVSSVVIPYLKESGLVNWLYQADKSNSQHDFQHLEKTASSRLKKLEEWLKRLTSAKSTATWLKSQEFQNIERLFSTITSTTEKLKNLFIKITNSLTKLEEKRKSFTDYSTQKLDQQKRENLQKTLKESYSTLIQHLTKWDTYLSKINCFIKQENNKENEKCKKSDENSPSLFSLLVEATASALTSDKTGGGDSSSSSSSSSSAEGAEKAKKELAEVQKALSEQIKTLQQKSDIYSLQQGYATVKEKIATVALKYLDWMLKTLEEQVKALEEEIKKDGDQSTEISQEINNLQSQLNSSHTNYTIYKKSETTFHDWSEIFKGRILKNKNDKDLEVQLTSEPK